MFCRHVLIGNISGGSATARNIKSPVRVSKSLALDSKKVAGVLKGVHFFGGGGEVIQSTSDAKYVVHT